MKKLKIFNIILALIFMVSACDKTYDDIYDEIDANKEADYATYLKYQDKTVSMESYTLTDDDYATISELALEDAVTEDEISDAEDIGSYKNFSAYILAKNYIPYLLDAEYFSYTAGTEMLVTYNYYIGSSYEDIADLSEYELQTADYDLFAGPGKYNNFSSSDPAVDYIPLILAARFPLADVNTEKFVQYTYYGTNYDQYIEYEFDGAVWTLTGANSGLDVDNAYELTDEDYEAFGVGSYGSLSGSQRDANVPDFLLTKYPSAVSGDKQVIIYNYYGATSDNIMGFTLSETGWINTHTVKYNWDSGDYNVKTLSVTVDQTSIFKFTEDGWIFVPPLKFIESTKTPTRFYTLVNADYELTGDGTYHNFTISWGGILERISTILKANFNDLAAGDVFEVTYKGYDGTVSDYTMIVEVILDE
ncbi:MAG TPA: hypothetical protein DCG75_12460 [Bacteroidales bacterium]|nr:hypothetical protein [Bacteroidales bacterium]